MESGKMRKITKEAVDAFLVGKDYKKDNTKVNDFAGRTILMLHGHTIARKGAEGVKISNAGWPTATTKDRLNGILDALGKPRIYQKKGVWYMGDKAFPNNKFVEI
jgi:hypothetical protein